MGKERGRTSWGDGGGSQRSEVGGEEDGKKQVIGWIWGIICLTVVYGVWYYSVYVYGKVGCPNEGNWIVAERRTGGGFHVGRKIEIGSGAGGSLFLHWYNTG